MKCPKSLTDGNLIENAKVFAISFVDGSSDDEEAKHREVHVADEEIPVSEVLKKHRGQYGTLCFVIRRPG